MAIKYGEQLLEGSRLLYGPEDISTINHLKNLNRYYDKAGRLREVAERVRLGYQVSRKHFSLNHSTTEVSRLLYYKLLIAEKDYLGAIPVVYENIAVLTDSEDDAFRRLHYLGQLHGLYGLTEQHDKREEILLEQLELNIQLMGNDTESSEKIILNLGGIYCEQKKFTKLRELMTRFDMKLQC
ncbi:hypothetical protein [Kordiimonas sp.]|uniref:hypothetical protein n=1 Tax=Kordiimonas sp. TaxID=1970157 RepID=UPI003A917375